MFLLLAAAAPLASPAAPPVTITSFCSTLHQYATVDGTTVDDEHHQLCIDYPRWSRVIKQPALNQRFNGTHRFDLTPNSTAPSGFNCIVTFFGKPDPRSLPFEFIAIDADATLNRSVKSFDGFSSVQVWAASRPISPHSKAVATMNWFVENTTHAAKHEFLRTSCTQPASDVRPGAPGLSVGIRDFSKDFVTPPAPRTFDPPAGVVCTGGGGGGGGFEPSTGCKPACATGALCCKSATGPPPGACFKVTNCSQVHGDGFALDARANGLANHGLDRFGF